MTIEEFWKEFKKFKNDDTLQYYDCFHFELTEKLANELLSLVLSGKKKATSSSLFAYESENLELPREGSLSIVTDFAGIPKCVIETKSVTIIPFRDITYDICSREGEDDSLQSWQKGHIKFFTSEGEMLGYTFNEDMPVVFEEFEVVFKI